MLKEESRDYMNNRIMNIGFTELNVRITDYFHGEHMDVSGDGIVNIDPADWI
ncbi:MAG: hypothetical protein JW874_09165 [Spirochaetales bacterium]|nr:hypothetical protein [Spirochaetales bacterium]